MPSKVHSDSPAVTPDVLVPDSVVAREFGITLMSIWRWDRRQSMAEQGWPPAVQINGRNFRSRRALEAFKARLLDEAVKRVASDQRRRAEQANNLKKKRDVRKSALPAAREAVKRVASDQRRRAEQANNLKKKRDVRKSALPAARGPDGKFAAA